VWHFSVSLLQAPALAAHNPFRQYPSLFTSLRRGPPQAFAGLHRPSQSGSASAFITISWGPTAANASQVAAIHGESRRMLLLPSAYAHHSTSATNQVPSQDLVSPGLRVSRPKGPTSPRRERVLTPLRPTRLDSTRLGNTQGILLVHLVLPQHYKMVSSKSIAIGVIGQEVRID